MVARWAREALGYLLGTAIVFAPVVTWSVFAEVRGVQPAQPAAAATPLPTPTPTPTPDPPAGVETFYVSATGDGSAPETVGGAWDEADFNTAGNWDTDTSDDGKVGPGDTIILLDDDGDLSGLAVQASGSAESPISITAESGGGPVVDGTGSDNALVIDGKANIVVGPGINFRDGDGSGEGVVYITGSGSNGVTINGCDIGPSAQHGILFTATAGSRGTITSNTVHDNDLDGISSSAHVAGISSATQTRILSNIVEDNGQDGIQVHASFWTVGENIVRNNGGAGAYSGINVFSTDAAEATDTNTIRYNTVHGQTGNGNDGSGISVGRFSSGNTLYYNLAYDNDGPGFSVNDAATTTLYNNTAYANCTGAALTEKSEFRFVSTATDSTTVVAKNNTAVATASSAFAVLIDAEVSNNTLDITTNDWWRSSGNWYEFNGTPGATLATWNALVSGIGTDLSEDPLFESVVTPDFDLQAGSGVIDQGTAVGLSEDIEGEGVVSAPDLGAYEGPPDFGDFVVYGGGWDSRGCLGGVGTPDPIQCVVDTTSDSGAAGQTLRECVELGKGDDGAPVCISFSVGGTITVATRIRIESPYITIDGFTAPSPGITLQTATQSQDEALGVTATHDIKIRGLRVKGRFNAGEGGHNWEVLMVDGDVNNPLCNVWDDLPRCPTCTPGVCPSECGGPSEPACAGNARIVLSHMTMATSEDDVGSFWCDTDNSTSQFNFAHTNYHPHTNGCDGWKAQSNPDSRLNNSYIQNVYTNNGERQPKINEGCYNCDIQNLVIHNWQDYGTAAGKGFGGYGIHIDEPPNTGLNSLGNVFLPPDTAPPSHPNIKNWDCFEAGDPNAQISNTGNYTGVFWSKNVFHTGHNTGHCKRRPNDQTQFVRSYPMPTLIDPTLGSASYAAMAAIVDAAGMPYPNAEELAMKEAIKVDLAARLALCPGTNCQQ